MNSVDAMVISQGVFAALKEKAAKGERRSESVDMFQCIPIPSTVTILARVGSEKLECRVMDDVGSCGKRDETQKKAFSLIEVRSTDTFTGEKVVIWPTKHGDLRKKTDEILKEIGYSSVDDRGKIFRDADPSELAFYDFKGKEISEEDLWHMGAAGIAFIRIKKFDSSQKGPITVINDATGKEGAYNAFIKYAKSKVNGFSKTPFGKVYRGSSICLPEGQSKESVKSAALRALATTFLAACGSAVITLLTLLAGVALGTATLSLPAIGAATILAVICLTFGILFFHLSERFYN
jgi:hypothetical protein